MPKTTDPLVLSMAEELIRFGVQASRAGETEAADLLIEMVGQDLAQMSQKAAAAWLTERGHAITKATIRRQLGTTAQIRLGKAFADPTALRGMGAMGEGEPSAASPPAAPPIPRGMLPGNLELDDGSAAARTPSPTGEPYAELAPPSEPEPAPSRNPPSEPEIELPSRWATNASQRLLDDEAEYVAGDSGDLLPRLLPAEAPTDRRGVVLCTLEELRSVCQAVYTSATSPQTAALYAGLNPIKFNGILSKGLGDMSQMRESGEADVVKAVSGHWAAAEVRNGVNITRSASRGDVRAQKLLHEILTASGPDLDKASGGSRSRLEQFARQVRAFAMGRVDTLEDDTVPVNAG